MTWVDDWPADAACKKSDPDELFVQGAAQNRAKLVCNGCRVRTECLADALDHKTEFGVWGGMTERERRALLRRRPDITSWRDMLRTAREEYDQTHQRPVVATPTAPVTRVQRVPAQVPAQRTRTVPRPAPKTVADTTATSPVASVAKD